MLAPYLKDGYEEKVPRQPAESEVQTVWDLFFAYIQHHVKASEIFSAERKLEEVACENASCSQRGLRSNFRKCAGCEIVYFYSLACKAVAWRVHGHKQACTEYRMRREINGVTFKDVDFLAHLAREDVRKVLYTSLRAPRKPRTGPVYGQAVDLSYQVDHRASRFAISFFDWESVKRKDNPFVHRLPSSPKFQVIPGKNDESEDVDDVEVIIRVRYVLGSETRMIYVADAVPNAAFEGQLCTSCPTKTDVAWCMAE